MESTSPTSFQQNPWARSPNFLDDDGLERKVYDNQGNVVIPSSLPMRRGPQLHRGITPANPLSSERVAQLPRRLILDDSDSDDGDNQEAVQAVSMQGRPFRLSTPPAHHVGSYSSSSSAFPAQHASSSRSGRPSRASSDPSCLDCLYEAACSIANFVVNLFRKLFNWCCEETSSHNSQGNVASVVRTQRVTRETDAAERVQSFVIDILARNFRVGEDSLLKDISENNPTVLFVVHVRIGPEEYRSFISGSNRGAANWPDLIGGITDNALQFIEGERTHLRPGSNILIDTHAFYYTPEGNKDKPVHSAIAASFSIGSDGSLTGTPSTTNLKMPFHQFHKSVLYTNCPDLKTLGFENWYQAGFGQIPI